MDDFEHAKSELQEKPGGQIHKCEAHFPPHFNQSSSALSCYTLGFKVTVYFKKFSANGKKHLKITVLNHPKWPLLHSPAKSNATHSFKSS